MGGGIGEIKRRLEKLLDASNGLAEIIERARLWVMFDRDADPADRRRESKDSRKVRELAAQIQTPWPLHAHQLERRTIENYIPVETICDWWVPNGGGQKNLQDRVDTAQTFASLDAELRHNFPMKTGLLGDLSNVPKKDRSADKLRADENLDPLYHRLDHDQLDRLKVGFKGLADAFSTTGVINDIELHQEVTRDERQMIMQTIRERM